MVASSKSSLILSLAAFVGMAWTACALDYADVRNLMQNQVAESVIINMVNQSGPIAVTADQANELRALGASESLVGTLQAYSAASAPQGAITYVEPPVDTTAYASPTTTYVEPPVVADSTVYMDPSVTYVDPGVTYYDPTPPVVVYESAPTYVYPSYPTYPAYRYGPSWGFSIGIGNSRRYHRPSRPSGGHRPGPGRPGRPGRPHRR